MSYTVKDLIEELQQLDPGLRVGISSDDEGNSVDDWSGDISYAVYRDWESRGDQFSGYIYGEDDEGFETETEVTEENATAIIIWP